MNFNKSILLINKMHFIYLRYHWSYIDRYSLEPLLKLGCTDVTPFDREVGYIPGEFERGNYVMVILLKNVSSSKIVESCLKRYFSEIHRYCDGGTEFYLSEIKDKIIGYLEQTAIDFEVIPEDEIEKIKRVSRDKNDIARKKLEAIKKIQKFFRKILLKQKIPEIKPYQYQEEDINRAFHYYQENNKGRLNYTCSLGKTFTSLWIAKALNSRRILIGVNGLQMLGQWSEDVKKIFNFSCLSVGGGINVQKIREFIEKNESFVIITTYNSANKIRLINCEFDFQINDEAHHLTSINFKESTKEEKYTFVQILKINAKKVINLTATEKYIFGNCDSVSNNDEEYFGNLIASRSLYWAIKNNILPDYRVHVCFENENNTLLKKDKIKLNAYTLLKKMKESIINHAIMFVNNTKNTENLRNTIYEFNNNFKLENLRCEVYTCETTKSEKKRILDFYEKNLTKDNFSDYKSIIIVAYCLGEGYNNQWLNGSIPVETMTSTIRCVQAILRSGRPYKFSEKKVNNIVMACFLEEDKSKFREIMMQLAKEDGEVIQKVFFEFPKEQEKCESGTGNNSDIVNDDEINEIKDYIIPRERVGITYEQAKLLVQQYGIKTIESYRKKCEENIHLDPNPDILYKKKWKNWAEYLSTPRTFYDLETCKKKVAEYILKYPELNKKYLELSDLCIDLCNLDNMFPPFDLWIDYYPSTKNLTDIIKINHKKKTFGVLL